MRIYTKIVIDMEKGSINWSESEWTDNYSGPVSGAKGGGGGTEPDKAYNKGMLAISERQQDMADEMFNLFQYGVTYDPNEKPITSEWREWKKKDDKQFGTRKQMWRENNPEPQKRSDQTTGEQRGYDAEATTSEMELTQQQIQAQSDLLPLQTETAKGQLETIGKRSGVLQSLYKDALSGVDVEGRVAEHRAGVTGAFKRSQEQANRALSRSGIDPSSGRGLAMTENIGLEQAKMTAGGETAIRRGAESENFQRKAAAAGLPV